MHRLVVAVLAAGVLTAGAGAWSAPAIQAGSIEQRSEGACSPPIGRNAGQVTISCKVDLSPKQIRQLSQAVVSRATAVASGATGPMAVQIATLARQLGATQEAAKAILAVVGQQDV